MSTTIHRSAKQKQAKHAPDEERLTVRLTAPLNEIVRRGARYRGDISKTISEALSNVDLVKVKAVDLEAAGELSGSTTIVIDSKIIERLKEASKSRGSSMNLLINSALAKKFGLPPAG